jgi:hypothetical protein
VVRRKGWGSKTYLAWEKTIPHNFKRIEIWSMDHEATAFWKAMGFVDDHGLNYEDGSCCMSKQINK